MRLRPSLHNHSPCRYDPQLNRTYEDMADHYGVAILPARPRKPRDKAKVETCVLIVERYLLGRLRHRTFYSLSELNQAIQEMLVWINDVRPLRRIGKTRRQLFEDLDRPLLKALPAEAYVYAEWRIRRAGIDYHVDWIDAHDNLILTGETGLGKSWLACALGHKACRDNRSALYQRVPKLFGELALGRGDGRYRTLMKTMTRVDLLILDDWGLSPLDAEARHVAILARQPL